MLEIQTFDAAVGIAAAGVVSAAEAVSGFGVAAVTAVAVAALSGSEGSGCFAVLPEDLFGIEEHSAVQPANPLNLS